MFIGGDVFKEEARSTTGDGRDGVEHCFRKFDDWAETREDCVDDLGIGRSKRSRRATCADALPDRAWSVGHGAGDVTGGREKGADGREARASEDREHEFTLRERGVGLIELGELLWLAGEHDCVDADKKFSRGGSHADAGGLGQIGGGGVVAADDSDVGRGAGARTKEALDHGACHASGTNESEFRHDQSVRIAVSRTSQALLMSAPSWAVEMKAVS